MYRYYVYYCDACNIRFEEMRDTNEDNLDLANCPDCAENSKKIPYCEIAKLEIEEKTHGGRMHNGRLIRKFTGFDEIREERKLEKQMRHYQKNGKASEAIEAAKELGKKKRENTSKVIK